MQTGQPEDSIPYEGSDMRDKHMQGSGLTRTMEKLDASGGDSIGMDYATEASAAGPGCLSHCFPFALCSCGYTSLCGYIRYTSLCGYIRYTSLCEYTSICGYIRYASICRYTNVWPKTVDWLWFEMLIHDLLAVLDALASCGSC